VAELLVVDHLRAGYAEAVVLDGVCLSLQEGEALALLGRNGAGKTTLIASLLGLTTWRTGTIRLAGTDITRWSQPKRARAGIGRSYQRTNIFNEFSVFENARLSAQAAHQRVWAFWQGAHGCARSGPVAESAIDAVGLSRRASEPAGILSHGGKRQLEIAMCLATRPQVLLLDEPLAGMGAEETERMLGLLAALRAEHAVLLVEHDMDAVFRIADRITVMVNGEVIATDGPEAIRRNADVRVAYLGEDG